ncbi:MAG TPA: 30S ribosomal protein S20 [Planctomycetota bacterium]|nr:30S ribosomal protein S20 [Planctomycetota bacterium]
MPHTRSSLKRVRQTAKKQQQNRSQKGVLKSQVKKVLAAVQAKDRAAAEKEFQAATKLIDRAGTKQLIHANVAARKKSALAKKINAIKA